MEERFWDILKLHRCTLLHEIDPDKLYPTLISQDPMIFDQSEWQNLSTKVAKVEKLLDVLPTKGQSAIQTFCHALIMTHPQLYTKLFVNNSSSTAACNTNSVSRTVPHTSPTEANGVRYSPLPDGRFLEFPSLQKYHRVSPSQDYAFHPSATSDMSVDLKLVSPADEVGFPDFTEHKRPYRKVNLNDNKNSHYEWLKTQCEYAMTELKALKKQQEETVTRCDSALKEADHYHNKYKASLNKVKETSDEISSLRAQNNALLADKTNLEQRIINQEKQREKDQQEMSDLRQQQREVISEHGSSEVLNKMYDSALDKYENLEKDYDAMRQQFQELDMDYQKVVTQFKFLEEENMRKRKQYDEISHELDAAKMERNGLAQQCTAAIHNWDQVSREKIDLKEQYEKVVKKKEDLVQECSMLLSNQVKLKEDLKSSIKERDSALHEYSLVMSERDTVHKEIEQLNDKLQENSKQLELIEKDKKKYFDEAESLRQQTVSALMERDKAVKDLHDICARYGIVVSEKNELETECAEFRKDYQKMAEEVDVARKERHEALEHRDQILRESYAKTQKEKAEEIDVVMREREALRRQVEKLQQELTDALQEADIAKKRRDWAFGERDKIVNERESIRSLCDNLRRERDRAVSELAQAIRDSDELKKQKNEICKDYKNVKEKYDLLIEKEARKNQLNSIGHNHSRDSAIDADLQEWETETIEIDIENNRGEDLGFELVGGKDDPQSPNDNSIFVSHVSKGSLAEGKLKVADLILKVNKIDVTNVDKKTAIHACRNHSGIINMIVKRRKSSSRGLYPVHLASGKDLGIQVAQGLFVCVIYPGSTIAKEGSINIGDRIISVCGQTVESLSPKEFTKFVEEMKEPITLDVWRQNSPVNSVGSSPIPIQNSVMVNVTDSSTSTPHKLGTSPPRNHMWDNSVENHKNNKNLKTSGSQTDSLDSPGPSHRKGRRSPESKESDTKNRHSTGHNIKERIEQFMHKKKRHKSQERNDKHSVNKSSSALSTPASTDTSMSTSLQSTDNSLPSPEGVIIELDKIVQSFDSSKDEDTLKNTRKSKKKQSSEFENTGGTWPGCHNVASVSPTIGTVIAHKAEKVRPSIYNLPGVERIERPKSYVPHYNKAPPPPERTDSSYAATRHGQQNSDSSKYIPHCSSSSVAKSSKSIPSLAQSAFQPRQISHHSNLSYPDRLSGHFTVSSADHKELHMPSRTGHPPVLRRPISSQDKRRSHHGCQTISSHSSSEFRSSRSAIPDSYWTGHSLPQTARYSCVPSFEGFNSSSFSQEKVSPSQHTKSSNHISSSSTKPSVMRPVNTVEPYFVKNHPVSPTGHLPSSPSYSHPYSDNRCSSPPGTFPTFSTDLDPDRYLLQRSYREYNSPSPSQNSSFTERATPTPSEEITAINNKYRQSPKNMTDFSDGHSTYPRRDREKVWPQNERIRIPSNNSVGKHGSVEVVYGRNSPTSPLSHIHMGPQSQLAVPASNTGYVQSKPGRKPIPGETRDIKMVRTGELVGIQIETGPKGDGIFVSSVTAENSLAAQAGIVVGDQLLEVCGINMRNATYDLAASVLRQVGDTITMRVHYNPDKYESSNSGSPVSSIRNSPNPPRRQSSLVSNISSTHSNPSHPTSPHRIRPVSAIIDPGESRRYLTITKNNPNSSCGISLIGGNAVGIYVSEVQPDSPAKRENGLLVGDQLLELNGIDLTCATLEQALVELNKPRSSITICKQYNLTGYKMICNRPGDAFYVRANFDHLEENDGELRFHKDDILYIDNTVHDGKVGIWHAWLCDNSGCQTQNGTIPSKYRLEDTAALQRSLSESLSLHDADELKSRRGSGSARRSFLRRKNHKRNNSKDSRELNSISDASLNSESVPILDDALLLTYNRVERIECNAIRPVVLLAPLSEPLINKITSESPDKYRFVDPGGSQASVSGMEEFVSEIEELCEKNVHCLLKGNPTIIEKMHRYKMYPIVIFIKHESAKQIREVRDVRFLPEKMTNKAAKESFENFQKIEQEYKYLFSVVIQGGNMARMCTQIKTAISSEQMKVIWLPSSSL